jgi:hypothetical protein
VSAVCTVGVCSVGGRPAVCVGASDTCARSLFAAASKSAKQQQPASEQPASEQQAPTDKASHPAVAEDPHAGFTVAVGNGLFWLLPYIMYWASSTTLHSGMFDNGRLDFDHAKCTVHPS